MLDDATKAVPMVRLILEVNPDLCDEIELYWHKKRLPSRTAAMRALIRCGLDADKSKEG
jgi:hypothetical protein